METGIIIAVVSLAAGLIVHVVKMAMSAQKMRSDIDNLGKNLCEHIERNEDDHKRFAAVEERLTALHIDVKIIIDRLTRRKSDTIEGE
jgi:hypothetical protein